MDKNSNLKFSDRDRLIKLNKGSMNPIFERAIFFTTDVFQSSIEAKESLSLSYSPKYAFAFDYDPNSCKGTLYTNEGNPIFGIVNPYVSRVWPAFGHIGGASEFILTDGGEISGTCSKSLTPNTPLSCLSLSNFPLTPPFVNDIFHQDDTSDYTIPTLCRLSTAAISAIRRGEFLFLESENSEGSQSIGSINSARGVSVKFSNHRTQTLYSLSVGIKCDLSSNSIQLMFWGYAWQDWKMFRFFEGPITYAYIWMGPNSPISENELKARFLDDLCKRNTEFDNVVSAISEVLRCLRKIDDYSLRISHEIHFLPI
jgi:hypothetical protein